MKQFLVIPFFVVIFIFSHSFPQEIQAYEELSEVTKKIHAVVSKKRLKMNDKPFTIVAIGGCPGVGKSTIAKMFQDELSKLGVRSIIVSLDHWGLSQEARKAFVNELDPRRIEWEKLHGTLIDITNGKCS